MRTAKLQPALWAIAVASSLVTSRQARAQATYYIGESTAFDGNGCQNTNLNTVTSSLKSALDGNGWSGNRFMNPGDSCHCSGVGG